MKRIFIIAVLAALLLSSCDKKEQLPVNGNNEVKFTIDGPVTRVTTVDNVTSFVTGDEIAITSEGLTEDIVNEVYTVTDAGLDGKTVTYKDGEDAVFVAHYPANLVNSDGSIEMTVPSVQAEGNFHKNMFMVAEAAGSAESPQVSLKFKHQLAWVKIALRNIEGTTVTLNNVKPTVVWTADALSASGTPTDVVAWKQGENQVYWALVPAQAIATGTKFVTVETADKTYEYTLEANLTLTTSKVKTITLSIEDPSNPTVNAEISVDTTEDITWEDESDALNGNVNVVEYEPVVILTGEETITLPTVPADSDTSGEGWNWRASSGSSITPEQNEIKFDFKDASGWTGNGAYYSLSPAELEKISDSLNGWYKLTFSYKNSANIRLVVYGSSGVNNQLDIYSVMPEGESAGNCSKTQTLAAKENYEDKTFYINLTDYSDTKLFIFFGLSASGTYTANVKGIGFSEIAN